MLGGVCRIHKVNPLLVTLLTLTPHACSFKHGRLHPGERWENGGSGTAAPVSEQSNRCDGSHEQNPGLGDETELDGVHLGTGIAAGVINALIEPVRDVLGPGGASSEAAGEDFRLDAAGGRSGGNSAA